MGSGMSSGDWRGTWDEEDWEAFMTWADRCTARYEKLLNDFLPGRSNLAVVAEEMAEDGFFEVCPQPEQCPCCPERGDCEFYLVIQLADMKPGAASPLDADLTEKFRVLKRIPAYVAAHEFSVKLREFVGELRVLAPDGTAELDEVCDAAGMVPGQIAGGHGVGYDRESIGGNIANCKRALSSLELCIESLSNLACGNRPTRVQAEALIKVGERVRSAVIQWVALLRRRAAQF